MSFSHAKDPSPPFSSWPLQFSDPDVGFAWYVGKGIIVTQASATHGTVRVATVVSDWIDELRERHHEEFDRFGGVLGIHDWRRIRTYESDARKVWVERINKRPPGYLRKAVVIVGDSPLLKMAVAGANMFLAVASRNDGRIEVATNVYQILNKYLPNHD